MTPKEALEDIKTIDIIIDGCAWNYKDTDHKESVEVIEQALNELERLKKFKETFDNYELAKKQDFIAYENWLECEKELEAIKKPPTVDEVCKAIQDDVHSEEVNYKQEVFYDLYSCTYLSTQNKIITNQAVSPKTLILIGRFYEGLK